MTTNQRSLDVVICSYNNAHTLPRVLDALEALSPTFDLRLLVCDNASSDATLDVVRQREDRLRTVLLANDDNAGFASAVNQCLRQRRAGATVLLLNPDVVVGPAQDLQRLLGDLDRAGVGVAAPLLVTTDGAPDHACARPEPTLLQTTVYVLRLTALARRLRPSRHWYGDVPAHAGTVDSCSGAFMLIRPEALDAVGEFDERFWMYGEDLDWCRRARAVGQQVWFNPQICALHVKGASTSGRWSGPTHYWFFESMRRYYAKWYSGSLPGRLGQFPLSLLSRAWSRSVQRRPVKSTRPW